MQRLIDLKHCPNASDADIYSNSGTLDMTNISRTMR